MDLTLQIPLQSGTMSLLWSEAINSLYNSLLEVLLEIRVHILNKMSAYLYKNICLQLGRKTTDCALQCRIYYSSQQRFRQGPPPCFALQLSVLKVGLTLKNKRTDGVKWGKQLRRFASGCRARPWPLRTPLVCPALPPGVLQNMPFTRALTDYPKQKLSICW